MEQWRADALKREVRKQRLKQTVRRLRRAIDEYENEYIVRKITDAIKRLNVKRCELGFMEEKYYTPAWLSAHN